MPSTHDLAHLVALIEAAKSAADRLGPAAGASADHLGRALDAARSAAGREGRPDEGIRPESLTTDNDR
ncbi:MAG: hypothetical protein JO048_12310 [Methylobacteriaceae bacterium]|nr:hypothetical protein [Methylobacteriaceae bacterium]